MVSPELGLFKCFGCGISGDQFEFVQQIEGVDFGEALKILGDKAGVEVKTYKSEEENSEQSRRQRLLEVNHLAAEFFHYILTKHKIGKKGLDYLHKRGVSDQIIKDFKLGYAPNSWGSLLTLLQKRGLRLEDILAAGVAIQGENSRVHDRFRGRIMISFYNLSGEVVAFAGRTVINDPAKYINSPESPLFSKSNFLFGLNASRLEIKKADQAIIVEGQMDFLAPFQAGFKNLVASGGTSLTLGQLRLLGRYTKNLAFCFDSDAAGDMAMRRAINLAEQQGFNVKLIILPKDFKDPDECVRKDREAFAKAAREALNIYDFYLESATRRFDLSSAIGKKEASNWLLPLISEIPNAIEQAHYIQKAADLFDVSVETIGKALTRTAPLTDKELSSATVAAPKVAFGKEEFLLSLLLKAPISETLTIIDDLSKKDFSEVNQGRLEFLKERILLDPELDVQALFEGSPEPGFWQNLYLVDTGDYRLEILMELVRNLKKESLRNDLAEVSHLMRQVEASSESEKLAKLQVEFQSICDRLRELEEPVS